VSKPPITYTLPSVAVAAAWSYRGVSIIGGDPAAHTPTTQVCPAAQALAHAPQLRASVLRSASHPVALMPSQSPRPAVHASPQRPATHDTVAPAVPDPPHTTPHAPQLRTSAPTSVSQPLVARPSQSPKPAAQEATAQRPAAQVIVAFVPVQRTPHAPQFVMLVAVATSQPLVHVPSQLA
jgi:hypothetical protein